MVAGTCITVHERTRFVNMKALQVFMTQWRHQSYTVRSYLVTSRLFIINTHMYTISYNYIGIARNGAKE